MKKIVALVLSLVMVLGLATTAFGAITLWAPNGSTEVCDIYDGEYNTKIVDGVDITFHPGKALKLDKDGVAKNVANIPYYTIASYTDLFVLVDKIPTDVDADDYYLVKAHNAKVPLGYQVVVSQSVADEFFILKKVDYVEYTMTGAAFTAWSDACECYAEPELPLDAKGDLVAYYTLNNKSDAIANLFVKYAEADASAGVDYQVKVGDEVVAVTPDFVVAATAHVWRASKWDATGAATHYTCTNCKTEGTVINASINAPAGAKIDKLTNGTLIAYFYTAPNAGGNAAAGGSTVESAKTFDAGIAMYVGMSVMAAAGSAVVLKKKD